MNDRFRFRVWNTRTKKLREVAQITLDARQHGRTSEISNMETCHLVYQPHLVLEQCTGLKDKNGRLIYEGDIVRVAGDYRTIPIRLIGKLAKVVWEVNCFCLRFPKEDNSYFSECWDYEIVGNIHENPELLEGDK